MTRSRDTIRQRNRDPGDRLEQSRQVGWLKGSQTLNHTIGGNDRVDFYTFSLDRTSNFNLSLSRLKHNVDVQLFDEQRQVIAQSNRRRSASDTISTTLNSGVYYVRVYAQGDRTQYRLTLTANPQADQGSTPAISPIPANSPPAEWTLMVYMAGNDLERYGIQDFLEMSAIGSRQNVNVLVQLDRTAQNLTTPDDDDTRFGNWTDARRGLVRTGDTPGLNWGTSLGEVDMGQASTLKDFATWGMTHYRAKNYGLVLWGHGDGLEMALDDKSQDGISAQELNTVLGTLPDRVDLVGADACLMAMTEFAYEIRNSADVWVSSQELEPRDGWHYTSVLQDLTSTPTLTAAQLGSTIVTRYGQFYTASANGLEETLSAVNLSALRETTPNNLASALSTFAATMLYSTPADRVRVDGYRDALSDRFGRDTSGTDRRFADCCDLGHLFSRISQDGTLSWQVREAASTVWTAYSSAILNNYSAVPNRATGLSIYWSDLGMRPSASFSSASQSFAANTWWDEWLNS